MSARVVVAEDDAKQAEVVRRYLEREGHSVSVVHDGRSAVEEVRRWNPDLLVLDVMMPSMDGLDVCRVVREESDLLVLMLTARATEDDVQVGLDLGADDYLTKPFSPRELTARVRALLRRAKRGIDAGPRVLQVGDVVVNQVRHEVHARGQSITCTPSEFQVLMTMAAQPGRVFTRAQLLERLRGLDVWTTERTIDVHVMNLRRKIEPDPQRPVHLVTVYGIGYKMADGERT